MSEANPYRTGCMFITKSFYISEINKIAFIRLYRIFIHSIMFKSLLTLISFTNLSIIFLICSYPTGFGTRPNDKISNI